MTESPRGRVPHRLEVLALVLPVLALLALGLPGRSSAPPASCAAIAAAGERVTTLVASHGELEVAACETGQAAMVLAGAARWNPLDGPWTGAEARSSVSKSGRAPCSSCDEPRRSPSLTSGYLRSNGSADAHGARA